MDNAAKKENISSINKIRRTTFDKVFDAALVLLGVALIAIYAYPMYFVVIASFSDPIYVGSGQTWVIPRGLNLMGYEEILGNARIWIGYRNTFLYTVLGTLASLFVTLPAAYALSRKELPARRVVNFIFLFTMFFSGGLVPTYMVLRSFNLINSFWIFIVPFALNVYNMIITRTFFQSTIPEDLLEAARLDGCSYTYFFIRIVLPLSKAIIAVMALYYAVAQWNDYFRAMVFAPKKELVPLQLVLREILITNQQQQMQAGMDTASRQRLADVVKYALILVSTVPVMLVYPFLQKYFSQGVMIGAIKG